MTRFGRRLAVAAALLGAVASGGSVLEAQEHAAQQEQAARQATGEIDIVHHLADSHEV